MFTLLLHFIYLLFTINFQIVFFMKLNKHIVGLTTSFLIKIPEIFNNQNVLDK